MCDLEKDYLIIVPFPYGAAHACFSLPYFLSLAKPHSLTPPGRDIHEENQESLTFAVEHSVVEEIGTHPWWLLSPTHIQSHMPDTESSQGRSCSGALT